MSEQLTGTPPATGENAPVQTPPAAPPATPAKSETPPAPPKTYTETEFQRMSSSQYAQGLAAAMKEAGFDVEKGGDFKKQMKAFREWQDAQKTDLEKANERAGTAEKTLAERSQEIGALKAQLEAAKKGVKPESVSHVVLLAQSMVDEQTDISAAMDKVLELYPQFKGGSSAVPGAPNPPLPDGGNKDPFLSGLEQKR